MEGRGLEHIHSLVCCCALNKHFNILWTQAFLFTGSLCPRACTHNEFKSFGLRRPVYCLTCNIWSWQLHLWLQNNNNNIKNIQNTLGFLCLFCCNTFYCMGNNGREEQNNFRCYLTERRLVMVSNLTADSNQGLCWRFKTLCATQHFTVPRISTSAGETVANTLRNFK